MIHQHGYLQPRIPVDGLTVIESREMQYMTNMNESEKKVDQLIADGDTDAAVKLLYHSIGGKLADLKSSKKELIKEIAGLLNKEEDEIKLPRYTLIRRRRK